MRQATIALAAMLAGGTAQAEEMLLGLIPVPDVTDVRLQVVERQPKEAWPFTVERGQLICVPVFGQREVYFATDADDESEVRLTMLTIDPIIAAFQPSEDRALIRTYDDVMVRFAELWPFIAMGRRLCDQAGGRAIGPGEL